MNTLKWLAEPVKEYDREAVRRVPQLPRRATHNRPTP